MYDVLAIGEVLIDFSVVTSTDVPQMFGSAGGAPANVLAAVAKLGGRCRMVAGVGDDAFGDFVCRVLKAVGIDDSGVVRVGTRTTLAFVHIAPDGERSFSFDRHPGADTKLRPEHLQSEWFEQTKLVHLGSLALSDEPARSAAHHALDLARHSHRVVTFDVNYRPALWPDPREAVEQSLRVIGLADVVKCSEEELRLLTGRHNPEEALLELTHAFPGTRFLGTLGRAGSLAVIQGECRHIPSIPVQAVDTTAAGDAFFGALLYQMTNDADPEAVRKRLQDDAFWLSALHFANVAGALTASRRGAIDALPTLSDILEHMPA
ncbi:carbohydrate kinase family protein [Alicyclobacillus acidocaldarius]|uniref:PfkB domain protein n=1 Tax=Alicyclobacillus acidocaldarius (strain Tc-4-1) TaxID=1048834 RepID=F8IGI0_ALIAT|nr:carbohydrate kinase [Alicyclobacillus acidocaldarius]AEJ44260.1 PfkB domain protein [Alicyclobacillus acidocaldarius subsp. acidocaldarius Tc-4-1]